VTGFPDNWTVFVDKKNADVQEEMLRANNKGQFVKNTKQRIIVIFWLL